MSESKRQLLTIGVFFIALVIAILLAVFIIKNWVLTIPLLLLFMGIWYFALGGMRMSKPVKYERGAFSTMVMGGLGLAVGGGWFLIAYVANGWVFAIVLILLLLGIVAIIAALKRKTP